MNKQEAAEKAWQLHDETAHSSDMRGLPHQCFLAGRASLEPLVQQLVEAIASVKRVEVAPFVTRLEGYGNCQRALAAASEQGFVPLGVPRGAEEAAN